MAKKTTKTKPTVPPPSVRPKEDELAYEMWLTREVEQGAVEIGVRQKASYLKSFNAGAPRNGPTIGYQEQKLRNKLFVPLRLSPSLLSL